MNKIVIVIAVLALIVVGKLFFSGPLPVLQVAPEPIAHIAEFFLPVFGHQSLILTNTILAGWFTIVVLFLIFLRAAGNPALIPGRFQSVIEVVVEYLFNFVSGIVGNRYARPTFPVIAGIFFFVLANAWLSLIPGFGTIGVIHHAEGEHRPVPFQSVGPVAVIMPGTQPLEEGHHGPEGAIEGVLVPFLRGANTDLNTPLALAVISFILVEMWGIRANGLFGYLSKFVNVGRLVKGQIGFGLIDLFVGILETISELVRLVSFTFRLFGNMFAGEVLLAVIAFLIPWVLSSLFYGLELLVGLVQAFVFAALTTVFLSMAVASHGEGHAEEGHDEHDTADPGAVPAAAHH